MLDKRSFVLGMVTAFSECVAGGCKRLALSPPLTEAEYAAFGPAAERFQWILIAGQRETLEEYLALRAAGASPARSLIPFHGLLSYDEGRSVHTGFDAYRTFFPQR